MKLNNKGFAISSIMYIILILAVLLISVTLAILSSRKLILDKVKKESSDNIYGISYNSVVKKLKNESINYAINNEIENQNIKISDLEIPISDELLEHHDLSDKYLMVYKSDFGYDIYLGQSKKVTDVTEFNNYINKSPSVIDYKIYGNTFQEKYTGKNLANKADFKDQENFIKYLDIYLEAGTYYYSSNLHSESGQAFLTAIVNNDTFDYNNPIKTISNLDGNTDKSPITISESKIYRFLIYCSTTEIYDSLVAAWDSVWIQIEKSDSATEYEPYVGGVSSPNIQYPQEVQGVGDKTTNIFDGLIQEGDYGTGTNRVSSINYIPVKPNTTYRFSRNNERVYFYDENKVQISRVDTGNSGNTVTTPEGCYYIRCVWFGTTDTTQTIWINEGTQKLDYEPYNKYKIPLTIKGKNMFDGGYNFTTQTSKGVTITWLEDEECFVLNGTATATVSIGSKYINLPITKGNRFSLSVKYISGETIANSSGQYSVAYFGGGDQINTSANWQTVSLSNRDTSESNKKCNYNYISRFWFYIRSGVSFNNYKIKIQLEEGDVATEYNDYVDPIKTNIYLDEPLIKIDNYVDYLEYQTQTLLRRIGKYTFNGDENWILGSEYKDNTIRFYIPAADSPIKNGLSDVALSNYFESEIYDKRGDNEGLNKIYVGGNNKEKSVQIRMNKNIIPSVDELKTYLKYIESLKYPLTVYNAFDQDNQNTIELPTLEIPDGYTSLEIETQIQPTNVEFTIVEKIRKL